MVIARSGRNLEFRVARRRQILCTMLAGNFAAVAGGSLSIGKEEDPGKG